MNIQEARGKTGKARRPHWEHKKFVYLVGDDFHVDTGDGQSGFVYSDKAILGDDWQPYYEVKEIRPEKAGELWQEELSGNYYTTNVPMPLGLGGGLALFGPKGRIDIKDGDVVHGKGWIRLFPHVEDKNVERIEIERVAWRHSHGVYFPTADTDIEFSELKEKGRMKMILEIPKDKP